VLFSSDLFGGFVTGNRLFATDMSDFGGVADFHRHYMPHPDILRQTMLRFGELPLELIAPQHGRVLRKPLIRPHIDRLKTLDCGVYSLARQSTEIDRLIKLNRVLGETMRSIAQERQFDSVAHRLIDLISEVLPIKAIEFLVRPPGGDQAVMRLAADNRYRGDLLEAPPAYADVLGERYSRWLEAHAGRHHALVRGPEAEGSSDERLLIPLRLREEDRILGFALLSPETSDAVVEDLDDLLGRVADALSVVLEREALHRELELERDRIYKRAIRDPLTGLFTRRYCEEQIERMTHAHDRNETASFALVAVDIDHFKAVNDTYGHAVGDVVLKGVAEVIRASSRKSDMPVRFGGEEFFTYLPMNLEKDAIAWAERVRVHIEGLQFESDTGPFGVTVSAGVAFRARGEDREQLERRADRALYEAKEMGRNRVCVGR
jgi:diguanylate cyclase (GGDEF)-like protein